MTGDGPARPEMSDAHITPGQVAHWRRLGLVRAGGRDLAQVRAIAALRRAGMSLGRIRAALDRSPASPALPGGAPAAPPRFAVHGRELYIQHADGSWEGDSRPGQLVLDFVVPLQPVDGTVVPDETARSFEDLNGGPGPRRAPAHRRSAASRWSDEPDADGGADRSGRARRPELESIRRFLARQDAQPADPR